MAIVEVSFKSRSLLAPYPVQRDRLQLLHCSHPDPMAELRRLAAGAKYRLKRWIGVDVSCGAIVHETSVSWEQIAKVFAQQLANESSLMQVERLSSETIDLSQSDQVHYLLQRCNYELYSLFRGIDPKSVVESRKRIYSGYPPRIIKNLVEARRYLTFDFTVDREGYLVLVMDFRNEYRSLKTLDQLEITQLKPGQRLVHTYDGKSCEWVGPATVTIGQSLPSLGNISLLDYHRQRGNLSPEILRDLNQQHLAVTVRYGSHHKVYEHLPQLLKTIYDRRELPRADLKALILPIDQRITLAQKTIDLINQKHFLGRETPVVFHREPRHPPQLTCFTQGDKRQNLDFGQNHYYSDPWQAWRKGHILTKPSLIWIQVICPQSWQEPMRLYMGALKKRLQSFGIPSQPAGPSRVYDPQDALGLQRICQDLPPCDLVMGFVPNSKDGDYKNTVDPYLILKQYLSRQHIPSQMVTRQTLLKPGNSGCDQNIVFGILAKLGYLPWRLRSMPGTAQAFVGLDLGRKAGLCVGASAFVVDRHAQVIGWSSASLEQGETFSDASLRRILRDLFTEFEAKTGDRLTHVVVHRDGTVKRREMETLRALEAELKPHGFQQLDIVEVVKNTIVRSAKSQSSHPKPHTPAWMNPDRGWGWEHTPNEAIVLTTGATQVKLNPNAAPQPLLIRRRYGQTDLLTLAEQIYWLSEMHVGSTQVVRLPITTYYADRIADIALNGLLPRDVQQEHRLYFI